MNKRPAILERTEKMGSVMYGPIEELEELVTYILDLEKDHERLLAIAAHALGELQAEARVDGAQPALVTGRGYTQLPEAMQRELHTPGLVWFLRGKERWEAWVEGDLTKLLREP
jgi:hypothetical protein